MRDLSKSLCLLSLLLAMAGTGPVSAARHPAPHANGPHSIGKFDDWQAATHDEGGQPACYAFTYATASTPSLPARGRVVLTVTQRQGGRDAVAISAGMPYAANAELVLNAGDLKASFYTDGRSAFARDGHAVVEAFAHAHGAAARSPGPRNVSLTDQFSLRGFGPAYAAINKACPSR